MMQQSKISGYGNESFNLLQRLNDVKKEATTKPKIKDFTKKPETKPKKIKIASNYSEQHKHVFQSNTTEKSKELSEKNEKGEFAFVQKKSAQYQPMAKGSGFKSKVSDLLNKTKANLTPPPQNISAQYANLNSQKNIAKETLKDIYAASKKPGMRVTSQKEVHQEISESPEIVQRNFYKEEARDAGFYEIEDSDVNQLRDYFPEFKESKLASLNDKPLRPEEDSNYEGSGRKIIRVPIQARYSMQPQTNMSMQLRRSLIVSHEEKLSRRATKAGTNPENIKQFGRRTTATSVPREPNSLVKKTNPRPMTPVKITAVRDSKPIETKIVSSKRVIPKKGTTLHPPLTNLSLPPLSPVVKPISRVPVIKERPRLEVVKNYPKINEKLEDRIKEDFDIIKVLGQGNFSTIYLAKSKESEEPVAIKIFKNKSNEIENEYAVLQNLDHPNIMKVFEIIHDKASGNKILIMEFAGDRTLKDIQLHNEPQIFSEEETIKIFLQILDAVDYLHLRKVAHCDLKMENVVYNRDAETVKLIDFGFSGTFREKIDSLFCGTMGYMSPQLLQKKEYCPFKADVWALGIILFKMLFNFFPYKGRNETEMLMRIQNFKLTFPNSIRISKRMSKLISSILVFNEDDRPTVGDVRAEFISAFIG